ncbi:hypothetical protein ACH47Z_39715 [Streptomyces sp. NPDC020192]|uniref:hypothetical protein n=1 Tax=Streptomyces sp. NPDC020192 TaxID=3365066 RepID=UPI00379C55E0
MLWTWGSLADCPVVLDFDGIQVEVCHWKLDELSISRNTSDTAATITGWESFELTPQWPGGGGDVGESLQ